MVSTQIQRCFDVNFNVESMLTIWRWFKVDIMWTEVFAGCALKNFSNFTGEHLCHSFVNWVGPAILLKGDSGTDDFLSIFQSLPWIFSTKNLKVHWPLLFNVNLQYFIKSLLNALARPVTFSVVRNHRFRVIRMILVKSFWQFLVLDISVNWEWEWKGQCQAGHKLLRRNTNYIKYVLTCKYQVITSK